MAKKKLDRYETLKKHNLIGAISDLPDPKKRIIEILDSHFADIGNYAYDEIIELLKELK